MATVARRPRRTASFLAQREVLLIDREWAEARPCSSFEVHEPASGRALSHRPMGEQEVFDLAANAARAGFEDSQWRRVAASDLGRIEWRSVPCVDSARPRTHAPRDRQGSRSPAGPRSPS